MGKTSSPRKKAAANPGIDIRKFMFPAAKSTPLSTEVKSAPETKPAAKSTPSSTEAKSTPDTKPAAKSTPSSTEAKSGTKPAAKLTPSSTEAKSTPDTKLAAKSTPTSTEVKSVPDTKLSAKFVSTSNDAKSAVKSDTKQKASTSNVVPAVKRDTAKAIVVDSDSDNSEDFVSISKQKAKDGAQNAEKTKGAGKSKHVPVDRNSAKRRFIVDDDSMSDQESESSSQRVSPRKKLANNASKQPCASVDIEVSPIVARSRRIDSKRKSTQLSSSSDEDAPMKATLLEKKVDRKKKKVPTATLR